MTNNKMISLSKLIAIAVNTVIKNLNKRQVNRETLAQFLLDAKCPYLQNLISFMSANKVINNERHGKNVIYWFTNLEPIPFTTFVPFVEQEVRRNKKAWVAQKTSSNVIESPKQVIPVPVKETNDNVTVTFTRDEAVSIIKCFANDHYCMKFIERFIK